uniref:Plac8 onzin related protein 6 n=1 Tax=Poecilia latipinna TaxID=48699 RepID=A0A3B3UZP0_9TELE
MCKLPDKMTETPLKQWKSGLFDCFEDANTCCYGFWCCPFLACTVSRRFGENPCLPLCDMLVSSTVVVFGVSFVIPPVALSLRASIRNKRGLKGSLYSDILTSCCCVWCSWCQMHLNDFLINETKNSHSTGEQYNQNVG